MAKRLISKKARKRAAAQGALVKKVRAGVRGALAQLAKKFPDRAREIRAERAAEKRKEAEKAARKAKKRAKQAKGRARGKAKAKKEPKASRNVKLAWEVAAREKARADDLERQFKEALEKDRREQAARRERLRQARAEAERKGFKGHAPWEGPPVVDRESILARFRTQESADLVPQNIRAVPLKGGGWMVLAEATDIETGEVYPLRGYEIRVRRYGAHPKRSGVWKELPEGGIETSYVFWADRERLSKFTPAEMFTDEYMTGGARPPEEDFIMAWDDKPELLCARRRCRHSLAHHSPPSRACEVRGCKCPSFLEVA